MTTFFDEFLATTFNQLLSWGDFNQLGEATNAASIEVAPLDLAKFSIVTDEEVLTSLRSQLPYLASAL